MGRERSLQDIDKDIETIWRELQVEAVQPNIKVGRPLEDRPGLEEVLIQDVASKFRLTN